MADGDTTYSRPAQHRLSEAELAERIRAAGWPDDADKLSDGVVRLRQWQAEDAPAIVAGLEDGSAASYIVGMPYPYGPAEAKRFLARAEHDRLTAEYAHLAVTDAVDGRVLGAVGMNFRHDRQAGEIGYWTNPGDRRRGVALRAVALVTRWAFDELLLPRVELIIHPLNYESQCIASRSGFRREGLLRSYLEHRGLRNDYYCFARLADDPEPAPHPVLHVTTARDEELLLRPWRLRDAEAAQSMVADDEEIRRWCVGIPQPITIDDERAFIADSTRAWSEEGAPTFVITAAAGGEPLGACGVTKGEAPGFADLGYLVRPSVRGRGIAAAALRAITRWALDEGGFRSCTLLIQPGNTASAATARRAGYERAGDTRRFCGRSGKGGLHDVWRFPGLPPCG